MNRRQFVAASTAFVATVNQADAHSTKTHDGWVKTPNLPPEFLPKVVDLPGGFAPGEIHVDPSQFALFWTLPEGRALRYIVGIGRKGLYEAGEFYVAAKREWPRWTPTPSMIKRNPKKYKKFAKGVPGGLKNPGHFICINRAVAIPICGSMAHQIPTLLDSAFRMGARG
ncbi:hypothetical protein DSM117340_01091 [Lentibacter algarum]|jgi:lipoprotein-anchoring transpeptidase ErfK/SrfK